MKSLLFKIAHTVKSSLNSFSEALKYAWKVIKLRMKMKKGIVSFRFKKVDGSIREAVGTLPATPQSDSNRKPNLKVFTYFDVEKNDCRCSRIDALIF